MEIPIQVFAENKTKNECFICVKVNNNLLENQKKLIQIFFMFRLKLVIYYRKRREKNVFSANGKFFIDGTYCDRVLVQ